MCHNPAHQEPMETRLISVVVKSVFHVQVDITVMDMACQIPLDFVMLDFFADLGHLYQHQQMVLLEIFVQEVVFAQ